METRHSRALAADGRPIEAVGERTRLQDAVAHAMVVVVVEWRENLAVVAHPVTAWPLLLRAFLHWQVVVANDGAAAGADVVQGLLRGHLRRALVAPVF